uniref:Uncharacterized protein n=1 Tax=Cannabis sativa TaxID=3483 RepID=A0A803R9D9_CANSA
MAVTCYKSSSYNHSVNVVGSPPQEVVFPNRRCIRISVSTSIVGCDLFLMLFDYLGFFLSQILSLSLCLHEDGCNFVCVMF